MHTQGRSRRRFHAVAGAGRALAAVALLAVLATGAGGQIRPEMPDRAEIARLVWSTLIALDHANRTGNYTVLRDLGAPAFRAENDPARLAAIFARTREADLGLGRAVLYAPEYAEPPSIEENGMLRVRGVIPMRPEGVAFTMLFEQVAGEWRLFAITVGSEKPPGSGSGPAPAPKPATGQ